MLLRSIQRPWLTHSYGEDIAANENFKLSYCKYANNNSGGILDKPVFKESLDYNFQK